MCMTSIQVEYLKALENKRHNLAVEQLNADQLTLEKKKLSETIVNNLRNYKVNVTSNEIKRLANNQLNDRELANLAEKIRSDLQNENIKLYQALETNRSNLANEEIKRYEAEIRNNESMINGLKPSGKNMTSILSTWLINLANMSGIKGTGFSKQYISNILTTPVGVVEGTVDAGKQYVSNITNVADLAKQKLKNRQKWEDEDEIPVDKSQSKGPGFKLYDSPIGPPAIQSNNQQAASNQVALGNLTVTSPVITTESSPKRSNVIYSPGVRSKLNYGPGVQ